ILFLLFSCVFLIAQSQMSYDELYEKIEAAEEGIERNFFLQTYLTKAKKEKNQEEIYEGYRQFIYYKTGQELKLYIDSMLWSAFESKNNEIIAEALLSVGIQKYKNKEYSEALSFYGKANFYIQHLEAEYLQYKILYSQAQVNYVLGFLDVAIQNFEKCLHYFEKEDLDGYLNSLHGLASCYLKSGDFPKSSEYVLKGIEIGNRHSHFRMQGYFQLIEGILQFYQENHETALKLLTSSTDLIVKKGDFANAQVGYFYLGKTFQQLQREDKILENYHKVDSLFVSHQFIRPDLREAFDYLSEHYRLENMSEESFYFMSQR